MMSFLVANATNAPPVWVDGEILDGGGVSGISSNPNHFQTRSKCLNVFTEYFGRMPLVVTSAKPIVVNPGM
jgi:hypothetical protein